MSALASHLATPRLEAEHVGNVLASHAVAVAWQYVDRRIAAAHDGLALWDLPADGPCADNQRELQRATSSCFPATLSTAPDASGDDGGVSLQRRRVAAAREEEDALTACAVHVAARWLHHLAGKLPVAQTCAWKLASAIVERTQQRSPLRADKLLMVNRDGERTRIRALSIIGGWKMRTIQWLLWQHRRLERARRAWGDTCWLSIPAVSRTARAALTRSACTWMRAAR